MNRGNIDRSIDKALKEKKKMRLVAYTVSEQVEDNIKHALDSILRRFGCMHLHTPLYTIIKELLINAVKANSKNIYFENYTLTSISGKPLSYEIALKLFALELRREDSNRLEKLARERDMAANICFSLVGNRMCLEVTNPVGMTDIEYANVQKKLTFASGCSDIVEYFTDESDDPNLEGAGLGLILIVMILKSLGIGRHDFSVLSVPGKTTASLSISLTAETIIQYMEHTGKRERLHA